MKKYISMFSILTVLSGCGTSLDFWSDEEPNPMTTGKRPPMLNRGAQPIPAISGPYGNPSIPPMSANEDYSMPPPPMIGGEDPYMAMPALPPSLESATSPSYVGGVLPSGRRAPRFNSQQFAAAPVPVVSQQSIPLEPIDGGAYQPVTVSAEPYQEQGTAMIPPPPPPPTALELSSATSVNALAPINDTDLTSLEQELGIAAAQPSEPPKVIVPVKAPEAQLESTDLESLKPIPLQSSNNFDSKGYPVLASIPDAPPPAIPVEQDSRAAELRNSYSNQNSQNYSYADIPPAPPPMPTYQEAPQKIIVPVASNSPSYSEPLGQPAPVLNNFESQPSNTLMPEGPTVVIRSKKSAPAAFHSSEAETIQPSINSYSEYTPLNADPVALNGPVVTVTSSESSDSYYSTSTNVEDLSPISSTRQASLGYKPVLAQSRYSALRAQARNSVRY